MKIKVRKPQSAYLVILDDKILFRSSTYRHARAFHCGFGGGQIVKARPVVMPPAEIPTDDTTPIAKRTKTA